MTIHDNKKTIESTKREFQRRSAALKKCYRSVTFLYRQFAEQAEERPSLELHLKKVGGTRCYISGK